MELAIESHPDRQPKYSSPLMYERRARLLRETRKMIIERGLDGFSIRDLCRNANVAQRTLYNAFHDKDRLIGLAIRESYDRLMDKVRYTQPAMTLAGRMERAVLIARLNTGARNYAQALASIYFSPGTAKDVRDILQDMAVRSMRPWLDHVALQGLLKPWVDVDAVTDDFAVLEYGTISAWARRDLDDAAYIRRHLQGLLTLTLAITKGSVAEEAEELLDVVHRTGGLPQFTSPTWIDDEGKEHAFKGF